MLYASAGNIEQCSPDKNRIRVLCPSIWIHYVVAGRGYYNGRMLQAGEAFIVYKNDLCEYYPDRNDPWAYVWIRLEGEDEENLLSRCNLPAESCVFPFDYKERLLALSRTVLGELMQESVSMAYREAAVKMLLSLNVKEEPAASYAGDARWVEKAKEYIALHYHKRITVEEIAAALYVDRQYLRNLFVKHTGIPTKVYLDRYRMARAAELLGLRLTSIGTVALSVGYPDQLAFSKAFKKQYGISPSEYARRGPGGATPCNKKTD